jgi:acetyltransferase-like isoleucine patch superfamily enzyme
LNRLWQLRSWAAERGLIDPREGWRRALSTFEVDDGTLLRGARLTARHAGCSLRIGASSQIGGHLVFEAPESSISIGSGVFVGGGTVIDTALAIKIGDDVLISSEVLIYDHDSHSLDFADRAEDLRLWMQGRKDWARIPRASVTVGDKCWIGARSIVLKGVALGEGAVVGAGSVVTRNVPAFTLVAGNPARPIRELPRPGAP